MRTLWIFLLAWLIINWNVPAIAATGHDTQRDLSPDILERIAPGVPQEVSAEEFLVAVNRARAEGRPCGEDFYPAVAPLNLNPQLTAAALSHARDLSSSGTFSHVGTDGSHPQDRATTAGYGSYRNIGENVAMNPLGLQATIEGWLRSPGHCANIMSQNFTELGAGKQGSYSVLLFGRRWSSP